jgi:CHAT domain
MPPADLTFGEVADTDFILLPSSIAAHAAKSAIDGDAAYAVIHRDGRWFVFRKSELTAYTDKSYGKSLDEIIPFAELSPAAVAGAGDLVSHDAEGATVVFEGDEVVGFYDVARLPVALRSPATEAETLSRWLSAQLPSGVRLDETTSLLVWLDGSDEAGGQPMRVQRGERLTIVVQARRNVTIEGTAEAVVTVGEEADPLRFLVRGTAAGNAELRVFCFRGGEALAVLPLKVRISTRATAVKASAQLSAPSEQAHPDLTLIVLEQRIDGTPALWFWLSARDADLGLNLRRFPPVRLAADPRAWAELFFGDLEELTGGSVPWDKLLLRLALRGAGLYEQVLPAALREELATVADRIESIYVLSEEPWIPWEMMPAPSRPGAPVRETRFFADRYVMTRWFPDVERRMRLHLKNLAVLAGGGAALPFADRERLYLAALAQAQRNVRIVEPELSSVVDALCSNDCDVFHFCGHAAFDGRDPDRSAIAINERESLRAHELAGAARRFCERGPLVFLNACQAARGGFSLTGMGGWAAKIVGAGASAFIAPSWSVGDHAAYAFATTFYDRFLEGQTVGQAALAARRRLREMQDPAWLAYAVFADAFATVRPPHVFD